MILTDQELRDLTRRKRRSAQIRVLIALGVPYRQRPDGSLVVFKSQPHATTPEAQPRAPALRLPPARSLLVRPAGKVAAPRR
ncbi:MAG: DUF4224 domain-containing protein [Opitutia bacterium]